MLFLTHFHLFLRVNSVNTWVWVVGKSWGSVYSALYGMRFEASIISRWLLSSRHCNRKDHKLIRNLHFSLWQQVIPGVMAVFQDGRSTNLRYVESIVEPTSSFPASTRQIYQHLHMTFTRTKCQPAYQPSDRSHGQIMYIVLDKCLKEYTDVTKIS